LALAPANDFGARGPTFKLVFGEARNVSHVHAPDPRELTGYGWLYGLHVRSSIARRRPWQALYMLNSMRDQVVALVELAAGLPALEARGVDRLPASVTRPLEATIARSLDLDELRRAFAATCHVLVSHSRTVDHGLSERLEVILARLVATATAEAPRPPGRERATRARG
jgi:hypothetical protein